jgi:carbonic anhydrase
MDQNLKKLLDGNKRYLSSRMKHPRQGERRRLEVSTGQHPFAIIVGCSDSRIPPEILFDQGIGDLFIIRVAGNIVDDVALGSVEYAADHLGVGLVVVLGHGACGAVTATAQGGGAHGHITNIVNLIAPAVEQAKGQEGDLVDNAIKVNAVLTAAKIRSAEPIMAKLTAEGKVQVVAAYYDILSGAVSVLEP